MVKPAEDREPIDADVILFCKGVMVEPAFLGALPVDVVRPCPYFGGRSKKSESQPPGHRRIARRGSGQ
jgi:hypothetical protein